MLHLHYYDLHHQQYLIETFCASEHLIVDYYQAEDDAECNVLDHHQVSQQAAELRMWSQLMAEEASLMEQAVER